MARCRFCKERYTPTRPMQPCCDKFECKCAFASAHASKARKKREQAEAQAEKEARKAIRQAKEKLKTVRDYLKEAQVAFNAYIRERDKDQPCISCGRFHQGSWDAGHYRTVGAAYSLRFDESNCHRQCVPCNQHKSGNVVEYRIGLVQRIGLAEVERLEGPLPEVKWTIDQAKAIKATYTTKLKQLRSRAEECV